MFSKSVSDLLVLTLALFLFNVGVNDALQCYKCQMTSGVLHYDECGTSFERLGRNSSYVSIRTCPEYPGYISGCYMQVYRGIFGVGAGKHQIVRDCWYRKPESTICTRNTECQECGYDLCNTANWPVPQ